MQGGLALSTVLLLLVCIISDMAKSYILEALAWGEVMLDERMRWIKDGGGAGRAEEGPSLVYSPKLTGPTRDGGIKTEGTPLSDAIQMQRYYNDHSSFECSFANSLLPSSVPGTLNDSRHDNTPGQARRLDVFRIADRQLIVVKSPKYMLKQRKFEINALCRVFLGRRGKLYSFVKGQQRMATSVN